MILNEDLFEDGIDMTSLEDKFRYIKDHATYKMGSNEYFSRDCRVWDLNLTDEQEAKFDDFLTNGSGSLEVFWDANAELAKNIEQVGRMGGHLILSNKVADPRDFKYDDSYEDYEQNHLAQYYDIEYDESGDIDPEVIEENHEECAKIVTEVYDKVVDFNNRVDALIDLLKQTLDEQSVDDLNDDSNFTESIDDAEKGSTHKGILGKYGNIDKYYNDPDYNIYYKDADMDKFELADGFSVEDIIAAMGNGVQFVFKKGPASEPFNENLNEGQTRFSEIDTDLSQEIFNVVLPKKVIADDLVSFMYQFNDGLKAGMNKMELLVALKDARTPDEFGKYVYNNCDREKYNKIYNESYKVIDEDGNKVAQGGGFKSKEEAEMFAAQYGKEGLKVVKESFDDEDDRDKMPYSVYMVEVDDEIVGENLTRRQATELTKKLRDTVKEYIYVTNVEYYEKDGHRQKDYNDIVDAYKKDGKWVVNLDPFHWLDDPMKSIYDESLEDEHGVEEIGTNQFGDKQYKYKGYTISYFPYDVEYDDKTDHFESYIIESPAALKNGYRLPLHCEDENGEVINFLSLEAAKKWIDIFDGNFKLEVKHGNEIHAVINSEQINESFEDEHGVESITEEQPQVDIPAQNPQNEDNGLVAIINNLIKDEWDTIQAYKDAIVNFASQNKNDLTAALEDILNEENIHVGQLETLLKSLDISAENIEQGKQEAEEQINND